jgi:penicillin-binding protein 1A
VFAQLAADLGWDKLDATAHAMGITSPLNAFPSEVIGGLQYGVSPLEMADAYATIANGGWHMPPTIIDHIVYPDGRTASFGKPPRTKVFTDGETAAAISILKQVITNGTGNPYTYYGCPAAGKTGTANNEDNAWFVGFTPRLSTAVWVGFPQGNISMAGLSGSGFGGPTAGPIWHDFMAKASAGFCSDWPPPTTPWSGVGFVGPHSSAKAAPLPKQAKSAKHGSRSQYNNGTLYAPGVQPPSQTGGTGVPPSGGNSHGGGGGHGGGGNGGGGNGNGGGNGP